MKQFGLVYLLYAGDNDDIMMVMDGSDSNATGAALFRGNSYKGYYNPESIKSNVVSCPATLVQTDINYTQTYGTADNYNGWFYRAADKAGYYQDPSRYVKITKISSPAQQYLAYDSGSPTTGKQNRTAWGHAATASAPALRHSERCNTWFFAGNVTPVGLEEMKEIRKYTGVIPDFVINGKLESVSITP